MNRHDNRKRFPNNQWCLQYTLTDDTGYVHWTGSDKTEMERNDLQKVADATPPSTALQFIKALCGRKY